ncbi:LysE family translocator [Phenylobacterium sp.]|uniref:LysE family translocator n=1 Tax=Phenylobacterium sp. TaxID=1871053 RepID=UPI002FC5990C
MVAWTDWIAFGLIALGMAMTPGPNMIYLISRSISQGRRAGFMSLAGVAAGFIFYMVSAVVGLTAIVMAVPIAYDVLRITGACYLAWLAWQALKPGAASPFAVRELEPHGDARLVAMGLFTNLLNPKAAVLYLSLLPQFMHPERGDILAQGMILGATQIAASLACNSVMILAAGSVAKFLATRPTWAMVQRWLMGTVLGALAVRMALDSRR